MAPIEGLDFTKTKLSMTDFRILYGDCATLDDAFQGCQGKNLSYDRRSHAHESLKTPQVFTDDNITRCINLVSLGFAFARLKPISLLGNIESCCQFTTINSSHKNNTTDVFTNSIDKQTFASKTKDVVFLTPLAGNSSYSVTVTITYCRRCELQKA